jgi:dihydrodipicolinate synthase/N-acetylneuraminate lyase
MSDHPMPPDWVLRALRQGIVIPAHPLALTAARRLDERRQRALTRYYHAAGAGGVALAVHTTQFAIRDPQHGLFKPVLEMGAETISACDLQANRRTVRVVGICGRSPQAVAEAAVARECGFHAGLLSLSAFANDPDQRLVEHCTIVAREIPLIGFYLQPAVGGRVLSRAFWRRFAEIPNVVAIKIAPFNRYQTLDVVRAVAESGRSGEIALYTGNDDNILGDLLTGFSLPETGGKPLRIVGGLLGHWACWTKRAVEFLGEIQCAVRNEQIPAELLSLAAQVTDSNAALFDAANGFAGCIPGIQEVLRRQGLLEGVWCLDPNDCLSPGQAEEIDRVGRHYPHLLDDEFVRQHRDEWLA